MGVKITNEMILAAQQAQAQHGIPASITLAQITLESGGNYGGGLSALAYNYNNLFGQKAGASEAGVTLPTKEYKNGSYYNTSAKFRVYDSVNESIIEHGEKWGTSRVGSHSNYKEYAKALKSAGYATDPEYANKLVSIIERDDLAKYDSLTVYTGTAEKVETVGTSVMENTVKEIASPVLTFTLLLVIGILGVVMLVRAIMGEGGVTDVVKKAGAKLKKTGVQSND